jgi:choline kinase
MKVILLAAGTGQRLGETSGNKPKCLLRFDDKTLLRRHLTMLNKHAVNEIIIVTGYRKDDIREELDSIDIPIQVQMVFNPEYTQGSILSLWCARSSLTSGDPIILMDADVLYDQRILETLVNTSIANCFLLDRDFEPGAEPVKLCVRNGSLIDFRKQIDEDLDFDYQGESVGFFRFAPFMAARLATRLDFYISSNKKDAPYEEAIRDLLLASPDDFSFADITGKPWIEIDFPEDVERARQTVLNNIRNQEY